MKTDDTIGQLLHCRATEGEILTGEERSLLEAWYAMKDAEETSIILKEKDSSIESIRRDTVKTLERIQETAKRIQTLTAENDSLRSEIAAANRRLVSNAQIK